MHLRKTAQVGSKNVRTGMHWRMLVFAWSTRDWRELVGQLPRLALATPASWLGRAPTGNTGRSNVGMFTPLPIADDLRAILETKS